MSASLPVVLFWLSTAAWAIFPFISKNRENGGYSKTLQKREDNSFPDIPPQILSKGSLPTPDTIALARKWELIIRVDPRTCPISVARSEISFSQCVDMYIKIRAPRGKEDNIISGERGKCTEFEPSSYHPLAE